VPGSNPTPIYVPEPPQKGEIDETQFPPFALRPFVETDSGSPIFALRPGVRSFTSAISAATPGATIVVPAGTYTESFVVTKPLTFMADGEVTIIGDGTGSTVSISSPSVTFEGFSIQHIARSPCTAVSVTSGTLFLINCRVRSNSGSAVALTNDVSVKLLACKIIGKGPVPLLTASGNSQLLADQCVFTDTSSVGVSLAGNSVAKFTQCLFTGISLAAIASSDGARVYLDSCQLLDCHVELSSSAAVNVVTATTLERPGTTGIAVFGSATVYIVGNILAGSRVEVTDRATAHLKNNEFMDGSLVVWGYAETTSTDDSFTGKTPAAIGVFGDAVLAMSKLKIEMVDGSGVVVYEDAKLLIDDAVINQCGKSGVIGHSGAKLTLRNVEIINCFETGLIATDMREVTLFELTLDANECSGAEICRARQCKITNSRFNRNGRCGLILVRTNATVIGGEFTNNGYAGIHASGGTVEIAKGMFTANAKGGLHALNNTGVRIAESPFSSNQIVGVVAESGASVELSNCEFEENDVGVSGAGTVELSHCHFTNHNEAAVVADGKVTCKKCHWSGESKLAVSVVRRGTFSAVDCAFQKNAAHIEADGGGHLTVRSTTFLASQGTSGVHIRDSNATFRACEFLQDKAVAIFSEGNTVLENSKVSGAGRIGIVFNGNATGKISQTIIEKNGECGCQCIGGCPEIVDSQIKNHTRFGIYIFKSGSAKGSRNVFEANVVANICRE
jgi:nitrous oxidase accessory protein NosD